MLPNQLQDKVRTTIKLGQSYLLFLLCLLRSIYIRSSYSPTRQERGNDGPPPGLSILQNLCIYTQQDTILIIFFFFTKKDAILHVQVQHKWRPECNSCTNNNGYFSPSLFQVLNTSPQQSGKVGLQLFVSKVTQSR